MIPIIADVLSIAMACRECGSTNVYRSQRQGLAEGIFLRLIFRAPYRCRDCGVRYFDFARSHIFSRQSRTRSFAEFIGLRGRDHKVHRYIVAAFTALLLMAMAVAFLFRMIER